MSVRFLPLDLPLFQHKHKVLSAFKGDIRFAFWNEEELTLRDRTKPFHEPMPFTEQAGEKYPELIDYINVNWPFTGIVYAKLIRANRSVDPHVDGNFVDHKGPVGNYNTITPEFLEHQLATEPSGYRMLISGNRNSLYLCDEYDPSYKRRDWTTITKRYCEVPATTDCFALQTNDSPHGVDGIENDDDRLLLFTIGWLDVKRHSDLIEKSGRLYQGIA